MSERRPSLQLGWRFLHGINPVASAPQTFCEPIILRLRGEVAKVQLPGKGDATKRMTAERNGKADPKAVRAIREGQQPLL
jgi:hypothetical protein